MDTIQYNSKRFYFLFALITIITTILSSIVVVIGPLGTVFMLIFVFYSTGIFIKYCSNHSGDYFYAMLLASITGFFASLSDSISSILILKSIEPANAFEFIIKHFISYFFNLSCELIFNIPACIICALISVGYARGVLKGDSTIE